MDDTERPQRYHNGYAWLTAAAQLALLTNLWTAPLVGVLAAVWILGWHLSTESDPSCVVLGSQGVTLWTYHRRRFVAWDDILGVETTDRSARLRTKDGSLLLGSGVRRLWRLVRAIQTRIQPQADSSRLVSDSEIEACLGGPGTTLECRPPVRWFTLMTFGLLSAPAWLTGMWATSVVLVAIGALLSSAQRRTQFLRANVHGIEVRRGSRRRFVSWAQYGGVHREPAPREQFYPDQTSYEADGRMVIATRDGELDFLLSDSGGHGLAAALGRVDEMRHAGGVLPEHQEVPESAISLVRLDGSAAADRGLSASVSVSAAESP